MSRLDLFQFKFSPSTPSTGGGGGDAVPAQAKEAAGGRGGELYNILTASSPSPSSTPSSSPSPSHETHPTFLSQLLPSDNPLFTGGLSLMLIGATLTLGRRSLTTLAALAQRRLLVSLEIPSRDKAHPWFLAWMSAQAQRAAAARQVRGGRGERSRLWEMLSTSEEVAIISHDLAVETHLNGTGSSSSRTAMEADTIYSSDRMAHFRALTESSSSSSKRDTARFSLVPGPGMHYFRYRGIWIRLHRERADRLLDVTTGAPWETIKLTTLYAFRHILPQLLEDARAMSEAANSGKTVIYTAWGPDWRPFGQPRSARTLESVVLREGVKEELVSDVEAFMRSGSWYAERGVPYRRGYLLYGPPGSGKTSLITALAGSHNLNICLLSLSDRGMTDDKLLHLLANAPERSILILEDIDVAFASRSSSSGGGEEEEQKRPSTNVTFSGLLNALDGVASSEERIVFMTTNHPERLDPALVRPGRVDRKFELGDAVEEQVVRMMERFYGRSINRRVPKEFAKVVMQESARRREAAGLDPTTGLPPAASSPAAAAAGAKGCPFRWNVGRGGVSMAEIQGLFIRVPESAQAACHAWLRECWARWGQQVYSELLVQIPPQQSAPQTPPQSPRPPPRLPKRQGRGRRFHK
ncbi:hypothetical protein V8E36_005222 [Tilletia maclaganii]